ncbi:MAG: hypothetical protein ABIJ16_11925, partial [Bacteroidota bacterium]
MITKRKQYITGLWVQLIFLAVIICPVLSFSQETKGYVEIKVSVKYDKKPVENAKVEVYDGGTIINTLTTNFSGRFDLQLDFDKEYIIGISKENLV